MVGSLWVFGTQSCWQFWFVVQRSQGSWCLWQGKTGCADTACTVQSFPSIQRLLKAREDLHFSLKTQINATIRYGVDAIRAVFFSLLTLPAVHFLNKSRQRQSPGDSAAFPERISMDSARLLVRSCASAAPCAGLKQSYPTSLPAKLIDSYWTRNSGISVPFGWISGKCSSWPDLS